VTVAEDHVRVDLNLPTYTPVLDADFPRARPRRAVEGKQEAALNSQLNS
jgi:hypothetical protein